MREFGTWNELKDYLEGEPILNKLVCLLRIMDDGSEKRRIFIDAKCSRVSAASRKQYKQELPRQTDLITDSLSLPAMRREAEEFVYPVASGDVASTRCAARLSAGSRVWAEVRQSVG